MTGMAAEYFFKVNGLLVLLFTAYYFVFRRLKFLHVNRALLITVLIAPFLIPLLPGLSLQMAHIGLSHPAAPLLFGDPLPAASGSAKTLTQPTWTTAIMVLYLLVTVVLFARLLLHMGRTIRIIRSGHREKAVNGLIYCEPDQDLPPFSFFRFIVARRGDMPEDIHRQMLIHEAAHCRGWHSLDILLAESICSLLWANPLAWMLKRQVQLHLEFLADEAVLASGADRRSYQLALLTAVTNSSINRVSTTFSGPRIKHRIGMMNTDAASRWQFTRYLLLAPIIMLLSWVAGTHRAAGDSWTRIDIDARTETVHFSLLPTTVVQNNKGIIVVGDGVYTKEALRKKIMATGRFDVRFPRPPILGVYSAHDKDAVKRWGPQAEEGVIFLTSPK